MVTCVTPSTIAMYITENKPTLSLSLEGALRVSQQYPTLLSSSQNDVLHEALKQPDGLQPTGSWVKGLLDGVRAVPKGALT